MSYSNSSTTLTNSSTPEQLISAAATTPHAVVVPASQTSSFYVRDAVDWQMAVLVATGAAFILVYALVAVATFRVAKRLHPFILFFSEALANLYLVAAYWHNHAGQLLAGRVSTPTEDFYSVVFPIYVAQPHYLVIAVNRGCAIFAPTKYDGWWSRRRVLAAVWALWALGISLFTVNLAVAESLTGSNTPRSPNRVFFPIYAMMQRCVTLPSLSIYSSALAWVVVCRIMLWWKRSLNVSEESSARYAMHAMDFRIFFYCFISFLPNCYYMVVRPAENSLHFQFYCIVRAASPGLLLYVMSSVVREELHSWLASLFSPFLAPAWRWLMNALRLDSLFSSSSTSSSPITITHAAMPSHHYHIYKSGGGGGGADRRFTVQSLGGSVPQGRKIQQA